MQAITTVGLDIAKSVFQSTPSMRKAMIVRRQLRRRGVLAFFEKLPPCLIVIEACASSHHWSRELQGLGHTVRLMPPAYVKMRYGTLASISGRIATLSCAVASLRDPMKTAGVVPRLTATCSTFAGM